VIAISTYTEPAPMPAQAPVDEPPKAWEAEKEDGPGSFADILAGLLSRKTGNEAAIDGGIQVPLADFDGTQADFEALADDEAAAAEIKSRFPGKIAQDDGKAGKVAAKADKDSAEDEIPVIDLSAELLLNPYVDQPAHIEEGAALEDFSGEEGGSFAARLEQVEAARPDEADAAALAALQTPDAAFAEVSAETSEEASVLAEAPKKPIQEETPAKREAPNSEGLEALLAEKQRGEELALQGKNGGEKESRGRLEEARAKDKRRDRLSVDVRDFRTGNESQDTQKSAATRVNANAEPRLRGENTTREITLELRLPDQGQNPAAAETRWEVKAGSALENLLARELHQNFNGDIVRHASMALHDGGEGTIRLALKPESLGNVKIRLEMAENKITGHIVVESEEALRAFRNEIHSLEQAFRDSGFQNANLNLSLAADGRGAEQFRQDTDASPFLPQTAALRYDESLEQAQTPLLDPSAFYARGRSSINMLV